MKKILKYSRRNEQEKIITGKEINGILQGINDVIKVYNLDYTIAFFNDAGYSFYNKTLEEVKGKKCYEVLGRTEKCIGCLFEKVMDTKQMAVMERYFPELNKFMDVCCSPVLNQYGEVVFIVERLRDITEKKILDIILKESEERYRQIVDGFPDAVVIILDNKIVLANNELCNLLGMEYTALIGKNIYKVISKKYSKIIRKRIGSILRNKKIKSLHEYEFNPSGMDIINFQISSSCITYQGRQAVLSIIRDITEMKKELNKAAEFQRMALQKCFPIPGKVDMVTIYVPANTVSGDFYRLCKINDNLIVGIIVDVSGKGITAALSISAFDVLFLEEVAVNKEPIEIVKNLNKKLINYYEENYIAAACFCIDFIKNELRIVGAGINRFVSQKRGQLSEEVIMKGPFLGMFENSAFDEQTISFEQGDRIYLFTDGLDFIRDDDKVIQQYMEKVSIETFANYLEEFLDDTIVEVGSLKDDCTMIALEIK